VKRGKVIRQIAFGVPLAIYRTRQGQVAVMNATCVHMGADLSRGRVLGERLQCPLHEWEFGANGRCEYIPATSEIPERAWQTHLCTQERYGLIFAFLGGEPAFPLPGFPEDAASQTSRVHMMEFNTPYQVLASNSYDAQHFSSVHHRTLLEAPRVFRDASHHYGVSFRARVDGTNYNDRILRALGVKEVELTANCYGGNTVIAYSGRTANYIMFTTLPITATRSRIFVLNAMSEQSARKLPAFIRPLMLEVTHQLTLAFLHADIAVVNELQFKFGVLLPEADAGFLGWMRYWNSLPAATMLERGPKSESTLEADFLMSKV
jgi:phenylpropionate dioxygenase-like ring-hydroxylating dioxygenase large terminal subunit